jgi:hypothetical protein
MFANIYYFPNRVNSLILIKYDPVQLCRLLILIYRYALIPAGKSKPQPSCAYL